MADKVKCLYPSPEDYEFLPEAYDEWRDPSGFCAHSFCAEGDYYARLFRGTPKGLDREEREMIRADRGLMADEFHGRDIEGGFNL